MWPEGFFPGLSKEGVIYIYIYIYIILAKLPARDAGQSQYLIMTTVAHITGLLIFVTLELRRP